MRILIILTFMFLPLSAFSQGRTGVGPNPYISGDSSNVDELLQAVYGKELDSKDALAALAMLVYRINKKGELSFKSKKGSYFLQESTTKSA